MGGHSSKVLDRILVLFSSIVRITVILSVTSVLSYFWSLAKKTLIPAFGLGR